MKKIKMLVAVFAAVIAAAPAAKAEGPSIDFDGKKSAGGFAVSLAGVRAEMVPGAGGSAEYIKQQGKNFRELSRAYVAQGRIKKAAVAYYISKNDMAAAAAFGAKDARIAAENGVAYLVSAEKVSRIEDPELAGRIIELMRPEAQNKLIDPLTGALIIVGCMQDEACWNAVGDGVSAVSQWWNS